MEIHRADKAYRKRALWLLAGIVLMCALLLWQLHSWLNQLTLQLGSSDPATVRSWVRVLFCGLGVALSIPTIGIGMTLREFCAAVRRERRFPPAQWKTLRDVRVMRGDPALVWARRVGFAGSAALSVAGLLIGWSVWAWWRFGG